MSSAKVRVAAATVSTRVIVLVLHGGAQRGSRPVRPWRLAYLRMLPLAHAACRTGRGSGVEVRLLRNRVRGWNEPDLDAVSDARWALRNIRADHPGVPVLLIGHSMGGRVALTVADDPQVSAVCALAPWTPKGDSVDPVAGRSVVLAHGEHDRTTRPTDSHAYAERAAEVAASIVRFEVAGERHAMLRRPRVWSNLIRAFVLESLDESATVPPLARARKAQLPGRLCVRI